MCLKGVAGQGKVLLKCYPVIQRLRRGVWKCLVKSRVCLSCDSQIHFWVFTQSCIGEHCEKHPQGYYRGATYTGNNWRHPGCSWGGDWRREGPLADTRTRCIHECARTLFRISSEESQVERRGEHVSSKGGRHVWPLSPSCLETVRDRGLQSRVMAQLSAHCPCARTCPSAVTAR